MVQKTSSFQKKILKHCFLFQNKSTKLGFSCKKRIVIWNVWRHLLSSRNSIWTPIFRQREQNWKRSKASAKLMYLCRAPNKVTMNRRQSIRPLWEVRSVTSASSSPKYKVNFSRSWVIRIRHPKTPQQLSSRNFLRKIWMNCVKRRDKLKLWEWRLTMQLNRHKIWRPKYSVWVDMMTSCSKKSKLKS